MAPKKGTKDDRPAIFLAIDKGDDELVEDLLKDEPANLNIRNKVRRSNESNTQVDCGGGDLIMHGNIRMAGHRLSLQLTVGRLRWCGCLSKRGRTSGLHVV